MISIYRRVFKPENVSLTKQLVITDFKLRYQNSVLGYAWSLLRPLLLFLILYVVFVKFLKIGDDVPHYPIYLLLGIIMWNFFSEMTSLSLSSIVGRGDLIRKIRIPRWIIVLSSSFTALINLALNLVVVGIFMFFNHVDLMKSGLWIPLIFIQLYVFSLGISLFLAAAYVKYRDVSYIWEVVLQALFYLTPILYPLSRITSKLLQKIIMLNPAAVAIQDARYTVVTHSATTIVDVFGTSYAVFIPVGISFFVLLSGVLYFKKESRYFAENL